MQSLWYRLRRRPRRRAVEREIELEHQSPDERRLLSERLEDFKADQVVEELRHGDFFATGPHD